MKELWIVSAVTEPISKSQVRLQPLTQSETEVLLAIQGHDDGSGPPVYPTMESLAILPEPRVR